MRKLVPFVADVVLVVVFCLLGRNAHDEAVLGAGLLRTFWPFGTGLVLGWAIAVAVAARDGAGAARRFDGRAVWPTGVIIWLSTLVGGMALRAVAGQSVVVSFFIVAATFLALFLIGWRAAAQILRAR
ncbi:DUF3054 domain-containing protein [Nocardia seriolae]|uniref:DUF3054 domain-containing protein n=1 Tax=Nocardia seriolae TaxID=37332 RepID=UPI0004B21E92|nr:DUF3054 domain-containing protein [Nocardia seriolae]MTJ66810.1 DUF3054 family protein [Nocardia seriolae]MTJ70391.1 DUF3054 family protein [Nocardia seriolae]MTJ85354.1 DUF3054 family protein [Nocardia seriolae]MTK29350.1 DUF3054 family protein [Nocardia seriolae]MTK44743.1 DUF3054 family protein [Nocardia seriolae]